MLNKKEAFRKKYNINLNRLRKDAKYSLNILMKIISNENSKKDPKARELNADLLRERAKILQETGVICNFNAEEEKNNDEAEIYDNDIYSDISNDLREIISRNGNIAHE